MIKIIINNKLKEYKIVIKYVNIKTLKRKIIRENLICNRKISILLKIKIEN